MSMRLRLLVPGLCCLLAAVAAAAPGQVERDLDVDLSGISLRQVEIIRLLLPAARVMDELFEQQLTAAGLYPVDMSPEEFGAWDDPLKASPYTVVRRDAFGQLYAVPYHEYWTRGLGIVARLLARAAEITNDEALRNYLTLQARALITGDYQRAELAWSAMRSNDLDLIIGPVGVDADERFGYKAGFGAYLLLKDWEWSARLAHFMVFLPQVQRSLPVSESFKAETPEVDMKLNVYDLIYRSGYAVAGNRLVPEANGERVQLRQGARRLQLRNVMRARFDVMLLPVADALIVPEQRRHVSFEAHFTNAMFHEMAHNLGLRDTVNSRGPVRQALGQHAGVIEENKAAVLGLWMTAWLHEHGELSETALLDHYVSFLAGLFHSIHRGPDSEFAPGRIAIFNHLRDRGAFHRDPASGLYRVDEDGMRAAIEALAVELLTIQGSGDAEGAAALLETMGWAGVELRADLARLAAAGIPAEIVFRQGESQLGL
jgi:hypothetical protein